MIHLILLTRPGMGEDVLGGGGGGSSWSLLLLATCPGSPDPGAAGPEGSPPSDPGGSEPSSEGFVMMMVENLEFQIDMPESDRTRLRNVLSKARFSREKVEVLP